MKTLAASRTLALAGRGPAPRPIPKWVWSPLASEALIEALPGCDQPQELRAELLPLCVPGEQELAGVLVRVTRGQQVVHERPYSAGTWCLRAWAASTAADSNGDDNSRMCGLTMVDADGAAPPHFALPRVAARPLSPLLAEASRRGEPGQACPAVLEASAWEQIVDVFRDAAPDEVMLVLRGSLSRCPDSGRVFTYVQRADRVAADAAPDAISATAEAVADALVEGPGQFVALAHSHPVASAGEPVVVSGTDLDTFRKHLRWAWGFSLIANVAAQADQPEPVVLRWQHGEPVAAGLWVTGGDDHHE